MVFVTGPDALLFPAAVVGTPTTATFKLICRVGCQFKLQTNRPQRYHVRPVTGSMQAGEEAQVTVQLNGLSAAELSERLQGDKFLVRAAPPGLGSFPKGTAQKLVIECGLSSDVGDSDAALVEPSAAEKETPNAIAPPTDEEIIMLLVKNLSRRIEDKLDSKQLGLLRHVRDSLEPEKWKRLQGIARTRRTELRSAQQQGSKAAENTPMPSFIRSLMDEGTHELHTGKHAAALDHFMTAVRQARERAITASSDTEDGRAVLAAEAEALSSLASALGAVRQPKMALETLLACLAVYMELDDPSSKADLCGRIARVHDSLGCHIKSAAFFEQQLDFLDAARGSTEVSNHLSESEELLVTHHLERQIRIGAIDAAELREERSVVRHQCHEALQQRRHMRLHHLESVPRDDCAVASANRSTQKYNRPLTNLPKDKDGFVRVEHGSDVEDDETAIQGIDAAPVDERILNAGLHRPKNIGGFVSIGTPPRDEIEVVWEPCGNEGSFANVSYSTSRAATEPQNRRRYEHRSQLGGTTSRTSRTVKSAKRQRSSARPLDSTNHSSGFRRHTVSSKHLLGTAEKRKERLRRKHHRGMGGRSTPSRTSHVAIARPKQVSDDAHFLKLTEGREKYAAEKRRMMIDREASKRSSKAKHLADTGKSFSGAHLKRGLFGGSELNTDDDAEVKAAGEVRQKLGKLRATKLEPPQREPVKVPAFICADGTPPYIQL